ncbi:hypothetical protein HDIA_1902 [Hartmannibacter diazotrophicus]|uniref:Uncharacterized protein n=1 Tax=Hartmannibacter diazotrophicus TaxID=1482074 RepID=A0A2C9D5D8_9HYPH|nr:hypothetical protein [Hartmannibacter diazotrophicus]SON55443.1 hypothetical protein HDIA_1902 [Hartmannibacter diazotrophicus]
MNIADGMCYAFIVTATDMIPDPTHDSHPRSRRRRTLRPAAVVCAALVGLSAFSTLAQAQQGGPGGGPGGPGGGFGFGGGAGGPGIGGPGFGAPGAGGPPPGATPLSLTPGFVNPGDPSLPASIRPDQVPPSAAIPDNTIDGALPYAAPTEAPMPGLDLNPIRAPELVLSAHLTEDGPPLRSGVVWRVFASTPNAEGKLPLVARAEGGSNTFSLEPGSYLIHCDFGYASTTIHADVKAGLLQEEAILNAGGLELSAKNGDGEPIKSDKLLFDVYMTDYNELGERRVVATDVPAGEIIRLPARKYHIVSRYGGVNASVRADIDITAGKLTELELAQNAAEVTLKLVSNSGGEAIADTRWSILTPGGDIVTEGVGAFPSFVLAAGDYTVVAKHDSTVYSHDFEVKAGGNGDVEVLTSELAGTAPEIRPGFDAE